MKSQLYKDASRAATGSAKSRNFRFSSEPLVMGVENRATRPGFSYILRWSDSLNAACGGLRVDSERSRGWKPRSDLS
jgi:hypothetical protein